ncbi:MAG: DMT family transporter [Ruthenibacterium sp.]
MQKQATRGAVCVLFSAVLMSTGGLFIKSIPWSALAVNGGRNLFACAVTFLYIRCTGKKLKFSVPVFACAACLSVNAIVYTMATRLTTAANAVVIQYISPVFIILYLWVLFRQRPRRLDVLTCVLVLAGIALFFLDSLSGGGMAGNLLALLAAATYAVVFLVNMFDGSDALSSFFFGQLFSALIGLPWILMEPNKSAGSWMAIAAMGIFQQGVAYLFMCRGLTLTSPVAANILCMCEPILNPVWVAIFYGERIGALAVAGMAVVIGVLAAYNVLNARAARGTAAAAAQLKKE